MSNVQGHHTHCLISDITVYVWLLPPSISTWGQVQAESFHSKHKKLSLKRTRKEEKSFTGLKRKKKMFYKVFFYRYIRDLCMLLEYAYGVEIEMYFYILTVTLTLWQSVKDI